MTEDEDFSFTFSDEDFERRYSSEEPAGSSPHPPAQQTKAVAGQPGRSRNRLMRTLLRRRLAASQSRI
jgi:hypothetical protein